ncbi:MAG: hypothetical protein C0614_05235 [Desulfuromonas sp.]|nr:MAG: hypothetical protein C0614_05235 [Desulfuromonas sp.]
MTNDAEQDVTAIKLTNRLTIAEAASLKAQMLRGLEQSPVVTIDISQIDTFDVAGIQLLCACHRQAVQNGQTMRLHVGENRPFLDLIAQIGMERSQGCNPQNGQDCLWQKVEN